MAALFGPLAGLGVGSVGGYPSSRGLTSVSSPVYYGQPGWESYAQSWRAASRTVRPRPIYPAPPVKNFDTPNSLASFGPPAAPMAIGSQSTRADRLFGPLARLGANTNGTGGFSSPPFPGN
jgi:hypothetical protein